MKIPKINVSVSFDKKVKKSELYRIGSSKDVADLCKKIFNADTFDWTEEFIILCLNNANKVLGYYKISSGGFNGTVVDPRVVFTVALNSCASGIIAIHNHPSGNEFPSSPDRTITHKLKNAGDFLDIKLLDHIILYDDDGFYSFADNGDSPF